MTFFSSQSNEIKKLQRSREKIRKENATFNGWNKKQRREVEEEQSLK